MRDDTSKQSKAMPIYKACKETFTTNIIAKISLGVLFLMPFCYMPITALFVYLIFVHNNTFVLLITLLLLSSVLWNYVNWEGFDDLCMFEYARRYFDFTVYKESEIKSKNVLFASFPHGLFPMSFPLLSGISSKVFPEIKKPKMAVANSLFYTPVVSPIISWFGCIPADTLSIKDALEKGSCIITPDGIAGVYCSSSDKELVYCKNHRGFIKIALEEGSDLIPMYCFGHTQTFDVYPQIGSWISNLSRIWRFPIVLYKGNGWCPMLPRKVPIVVAIGRAIKVKQCINPTENQIDELHTKFIKKLKKLFNKYKKRVLGWENKKIKII